MNAHEAGSSLWGDVRGCLSMKQSTCVVEVTTQMFKKCIRVNRCRASHKKTRRCDLTTTKNAGRRGLPTMPLPL